MKIEALWNSLTSVVDDMEIEVVIDRIDNHPKRSPMSISYSSSLGGGGASFFFSYFLGAALVSATAAGAGAGPDDPKLKKELMSLPSRAFAKILGQ